MKRVRVSIWLDEFELLRRGDARGCGEGRLPLTPALSLGERGNGRQPWNRAGVNDDAGEGELGGGLI
jgi:hypothetical protein